MATIARLMVSLGLDSGDYHAGLRDIERSATNLGGALSGVERSTAGVEQALDHIGDASGRASTGFRRLIEGIQAGTGKFTGLIHTVTGSASSLLSLVSGAGFASLGFNALQGAVQGAMGVFTDANADMEQTRIAMRGLLKDSNAVKKGLMTQEQAADDLLAKLLDFSAATPFEFSELKESTRLLLAFKFQAEDIIPTMRIVGDASAGLGAGSFGIQRIITALGQMQAKGKLSAEEMNQLTEVGIGGWGLLADQMGLTTAQVMKMSEKGLLPAAKAVPLLLKGMEKAFGGQMVNQASTMTGRISTIKDNIDQAWMAFTSPLFDRASKAVGVIGDLISNPAFKTFATTMGQGVAKALDMVLRPLNLLQPAFVVLRDSVLTFHQAFTGSWEDNASKIRPVHRAVGNFALLLRGTVLPIIESLKNAFDLLMTGDFQGGIFGLAEDSALIDFLIEGRNAVLGIRDVLIGLATGNFGKVLDGLLRSFDVKTAVAIGSKLMDIRDRIIDLATSVAQKLRPILSAVGDFLKSNLIPVLMGLGAMLLATIIPVVARLGVSFLGLLPSIRSVVSTLGMVIQVLPAINPLLLALGATVAILGIAWKENWFGFRDTVNTVWKDLSSKFATFASIITDSMSRGTPALEAIGGAIDRAFLGSTEAIGPFQAAMTTVQQGLQSLRTFITGTIVPAFTSMSGSIAGSIGNIVRAFQSGGISAGVGQIATEIANGSGSIFQVLTDIGSRIGQWLGPHISTAIGSIDDLVILIIQALGRAVGPIMTQLETWATAFFDWVAPIIPKIPGLIAEVLGAIASSIATGAGLLAEHLQPWADALLEWIQTSVIPNLPEPLQEIITAMSTWASGSLGKIKEIASGVGQGFIDGIKETIARVASGESLFGSIVAGAQQAFGSTADMAQGGGSSTFSPSGGGSSDFTGGGATAWPEPPDATPFVAFARVIDQVMGSVPGSIGPVEQVVTNLQSIFANIASFVQGSVLPAFKSFVAVISPIAMVIGSVLVIGLRALGDILKNVVLPAIATVTGFFEKHAEVIGTIAGIVGVAVAVFTTLSTVVGTLSGPIGVVGGIFATLAPVIAEIGLGATIVQVALGALAGIFGFLMSPIVLVTAAIVALGAAWATNFGGIRDLATSAFDGVISFFTGTLVPALQQAGSMFMEVFGPAFTSIGSLITEQLLPNLMSLGQTIMDSFVSLSPLIEDVKQTFIALMPTFEAVGAVVGVVLLALLAAFTSIAVFISGTVVVAFNGLVGLLSGILPGAFQAIMGVIQVFLGVIQTIGAIVGGVVQIVWSLITGDFAGAWEAAKTMVSNVVTGITTILKGLWTTVSGIVTGIVTGVIGLFTNLYMSLVGASIIPDMISEIIDWFVKLPGRVLELLVTFVGNVTTKFAELKTTIGTKLSEIATSITSKAGEFVASALSIGKSILDGIIQGVSNAPAAIGNALSGALGGAFTAARSFIDAHSPSRKAIDELGNPISQGAAEGIKKGAPAVKAALSSSLADAIEKASAAVKSGADALGLIRNFVAPTRASIQSFTSSLGSLVSDFSATAKNFSTKALASASNFADAASKVASATGAGAESLTKLRSFIAPARSTIASFTQSMGAITSDFAKVGSGFKARALETASNFADAASKVAGTAGAGVENLMKISSFVAPARTTMASFAQSMGAITTDFAQVGSTFKGSALKSASDFAEASGKVASAVGSGVDGLMKLRGFIAPSRNVVVAFVESLAAITADFAKAGKAFGEKALESAAMFADAAGKVVSTVQAGVTAFTALRGFIAPTNATIAAFGDAIQLLVAEFGRVAQSFEHNVLASATTFADVANKVITVVGAGAEALTKLMGFVAPSRDSISGFAQAIRDVIADFWHRSQEIQYAFDGAVTLFADTAMQAIQVLSTGVDALKKLNDLHVPTRDAIGNFAMAIRDVLADFWHRAQEIRYVFVDQIATQFVETAMQAIALIGNGVDALKKLNTFVAPTRTAIESFFNTLADILVDMTQMAREFADQGLQATSIFAVTAANIVGAVGAAVDTLVKLRGFIAPAQGSIKAFFATLADVLVDMVQLSREFADQGLDAVTVFSESVGKIIAPIGTAVDAFDKLLTFIGVPEYALDAFFAAMADVAVEMVQLSRDFADQALDATAEFADTIGRIIAPIGTALDVFKKLEEFKSVPIEKLNTLAGYMYLAAYKMREISRGFEAEAMPAVAEFADAINRVLTPIGTALDIFKKLEEFKGVPVEVFTSLGGHMFLAVQMMINVTSAFEAQALVAAARFGEIVGQVLGAIKTALDLMSSLKDYEGGATDKFGAIETDFNTIVAGLQRMSAQADVAVQAAYHWRDQVFAAMAAIQQGSAAAAGIAGGGSVAFNPNPPMLPEAPVLGGGASFGQITSAPPLPAVNGSQNASGSKESVTVQIHIDRVDSQVDIETMAYRVADVLRNRS